MNFLLFKLFYNVNKINVHVVPYGLWDVVARGEVASNSVYMYIGCWGVSKVPGKS